MNARQLLPLLVSPVAVALGLLVFGVVARRRWALVAGIVVIWISSLPLVSESMMRTLEGAGGRQPIATAPVADAIVVLSIGRNISRGPARVSEWIDPDRFFAGVELFKAGRAPRLVFTGGWTADDDKAPLEGDVMADYAKQLGVPQDAIVTTPLVYTTEQEAAAVSQLARQQSIGRRILLVTSAFHMARAERLFARAGFDVLRFPVDYTTGDGGLGLRHFVPNAAALSQTQRALREFYGRGFYRLLQ